MTGPEHYAEAERLLADAVVDITVGQSDGNHREHDEQVARAQVHATLALAAATVTGRPSTADRAVRDAWERVTS